MKSLTFGTLCGAAGFVGGVLLVNSALFKIWKEGNWKNFVTDIDNRLAEASGRSRQLSGDQYHFNIAPSVTDVRGWMNTPPN